MGLCKSKLEVLKSVVPEELVQQRSSSSPNEIDGNWVETPSTSFKSWLKLSSVAPNTEIANSGLNLGLDNTADLWLPEERYNKLFDRSDKKIYNQKELEKYLEEEPKQLQDEDQEQSTEQVTAGCSPTVKNNVNPTAGCVTTAEQKVNHIQLNSGLYFRSASITNGSNHTGNIITAIKSGDSDLVSELIHSGVDVNVRGMWENTPLITACQYGHAKIVDLLLNNESIDVNSVNEKGNSALLFAVIEGMDCVVQCLLSRGAKVDVSPSRVYNKILDCSSLYTSLTAAIVNNHVNIFTALVEHSKDEIDINAIYDFEVFTGRKDAKLNDFTLVSLAAAFGRREIFEILAKKGASYNYTDIQSCTPLHYAASCLLGSSIVPLLGTTSASSKFIDLKNLKGQTALHIACENKNISFIKELLKCGCDVNSKSNDGSTALHIAIKRRSEDLFDILVTNGADLSICDNKGISPREAIGKLINTKGANSMGFAARMVTTLSSMDAHLEVDT